MKKNKILSDKREQYVKKQINKSANITKEIKKISERLFLSERTIWDIYTNEVTEKTE